MTTTKDEMRIVELCDELEKAKRYYCELDDYRKVQSAENERLRLQLIELCRRIRELEAENERLRAALEEIASHGALINRVCFHAREMARKALSDVNRE